MLTRRAALAWSSPPLLVLLPALCWWVLDRHRHHLDRLIRTLTERGRRGWLR